MVLESHSPIPMPVSLLVRSSSNTSASISGEMPTILGLQELVEKTQLNNIDIQYLFEKYKQTTAMTYIRRRRENRQTYLITKERITPIFIRND